MNNHLSSEQISEFMTGNATPEQAQHAANCAECAAELSELQETLSTFRDSVQHWAKQSGGSVIPDRAFLGTEERVFSVHPLRWALAAAALIVLAIPVYNDISNRDRQNQAEDALLLEQVNAHLSRAVPAPMEPLLELLSDVSADEIGGRQ
jgi:hypothetical protein